MLGMFDTGIFSSYRVYFSSPERINAPTSTRPAKSRVVVAGAVSAMVLYFFALNLRRAGIAEGVIMKIGGWRTRSVFERYAIVSQTDIAEALKKLEAS
jgi:hypothetical protein